MNIPRRRLKFVGLSILLLTSSILGVFLPLQGKVEAEPIKKEIVYNSESGVKPHPYRTALSFGKSPTAAISISGMLDIDIFPCELKKKTAKAYDDDK
ncbi:MAG: hypothetical protein ACE3K2_06245 [Paenibacillus sp.]|uniref:hypothetical protein n=1 Tax=Paenibacillus sp. TaxID=58172 RepID=UPI003B79E802